MTDWGSESQMIETMGIYLEQIPGASRKANRKQT